MEQPYDVQEQREFKVLKANALIQQSRYQLSAQEQKLLMFILMKIRPNDTELKETTFKIHSFCKICGIHDHSGGNLDYVKKTIKRLADRSIWVTTLDSTSKKPKETLIRWIAKPTISRGVVTIRLDEDLAPYLLQIKKNYTEITVMYPFAMDCQYSLRLYEVLKSYSYQQNPHQFELDELKHMLDVKKYDRFADFRRFVFDPAIEEINSLTDLYVEFDFRKTSRKYTSVVFFIRQKDTVPDMLETWKRIGEKLDKCNPEDVEQLALENVVSQ